MNTNSENPKVGKAFQEMICKSVVEYYVRIDAHLLWDVKVFEVDEQGRIKVIKS